MSCSCGTSAETRAVQRRKLAAVAWPARGLPLIPSYGAYFGFDRRKFVRALDLLADKAPPCGPKGKCPPGYWCVPGVGCMQTQAFFTDEELISNDKLVLGDGHYSLSDHVAVTMIATGVATYVSFQTGGTGAVVASSTAAAVVAISSEKYANENKPVEYGPQDYDDIIIEDDEGVEKPEVMPPGLTSPTSLESECGGIFGVEWIECCDAHPGDPMCGE